MATSNGELAALLRDIASTLRETGANRYRTGAYERAADTLESAEMDVASTYDDEGMSGVEKLEGIGEGIASVIAEYLDTGRSRLLDDLRAQASPESLFAEIPGIGPELARRIGEELGIGSLEELENAAHDGRLETVSGVGGDRVQAVRDHLGQRLARGGSGADADRSDRSDGGAGGEARPSDAILLEIDREYRAKADGGELRTIAPRRFNPEGEAWLPILETDRDGWSFTALYSNTARAHREGKTHDWVVIYYERDGEKGQNTVVTAERGPHRGERIVAH